VRRTALPGLLALCALAFGCFKPDDGREPPLDRIYFPTGLALSPDGDRLYVANSDWDLQFNAGSVQAYDAARLREWLPTSCTTDADCPGPDQRCDLSSSELPDLGNSGTRWCVDASAPDVCRGLGLQNAGDRLIQPGLCGALDNRSPDLLLGSVSVGAFATDLIHRSNPLGGGGRLFVPVRSDATLHWIDVPAGTSPGSGRELECGQDGRGECDADHRRGDDNAEATPYGTGLPIEPYAVAASPEGEAVLVSHQTEGKVSLFINDWQQPELGPQLKYVLDGLGGRPVHISAIPVPELARLDRLPGQPRELGYQPGFWVTFRNAAYVQLLRYFDAQDSPNGQPFLSRAFADRLLTTPNTDVRAMASDDTARRGCELACGAGDSTCLAECARIPLRVFLANRAPVTPRPPGSLLIGSTTSVRRADPSNDRLQISDLVAVDDGPSRISAGRIIDERGQPSQRVFLTCFEANTITIYDPDARVIDARVPTGRGPSALVVDEAHALAYVAHFTDSYVGVIDLDARHASFGTLILALGTPSAPRGDDR
jgi:DNA-binding beta-propeller fold protein YncE